ncbi:cyanophycinase [Stenotrophomonas sp. MH1]|uniref:Cyanophycinase n=1 Tax=Stenotrophomonas capsici TaxID=3110230 RepID=A0ABU5V172_9GAMM|nr:cyanophycinase [Stenotrophomonas sp. MH1]MEA5667091.1 cyanophycinase [Stenotrophomonas sp. MH1]
MKRVNFCLGRLALVLLALGIAGTAVAQAGAASQNGYRYYQIGNLDAPRPGKTEAAMLLMGGGDWAPEAFHWWVERAGHGRVVILRASGDDELQKELFNDVGGVTAVQTLVFDNRAAADDPEVLRVVRGADAIFIAGGDQARYIRFWKGTQLNDALNAHVRAGKPIGGTSAGLAILGAYAYGALDGGSVDSVSALGDPMGSEVTMDKDFLTMPFLSNVVTDTHFAKRDRLGRLIVFVARAAQDSGKGDIVGIGVDEDTALCVEADGRARVYSLNGGYAWLVMPQRAAERLTDGAPLEFNAIPVTGVGTGSRLHLDGFKVDNAAFTAVASVVDGELQLRPN